MKFLSWLPLLILAAIPPDQLPELPLCGFRWFTGLPCPLCGLTHAVSYFLHGQFHAAAEAHLLSPLLVALLFGYPLLNERWWHKQRTRTALTAAVLIGIFGAGRWCAIMVNNG